MYNFDIFGHFLIIDDLVKLMYRKYICYFWFSIIFTANLPIDTINKIVKGGANDINLLTQYVNFGIDASSSAGFGADIHYMIPFGLSESGSSATSMGSSTSSSFNDTNPATSLTITATSDVYLNKMWYLQNDIEIDKVEWFCGADSASGDNVAAHLMKYDLTKDNSSASGDLANGVVMFDGATLAHAGQEQIYYQDMDDQVTTASAGQVIVFTFAQDTTNSDYSIRCFIKYHIT